MVDFLSWMMFKNYEYGEEFFYDIIKKLVVDETVLFRYKIKREKNLIIKDLLRESILCRR
jgi:hypothetical protein